MKKSFLIVSSFLLILFCLKEILYAEGYVEVDDQSRGNNTELDMVMSDTHRASGQGGTVYHVNVDGQTFDLYLNAGETINGSTVVAGYANGNVPSYMNGEPKDVAALCRAAGREDLASVIDAESARYRVDIEQFYDIKYPNSNEKVRMTEEEIRNQYAVQMNAGIPVEKGTIGYDLWSIIQNPSHHDEEKNDPYFGIWTADLGGGRIVTPSITPSVTNIPSTSPSKTPTKTPTSSLTKKPTVTPTKTPTKTPTPPSKVVGDYKLSYVSTPDCNKTISGDLIIYDDIFGVEEGKPIPTSELLKVKGHTDYIAKIDDIEKWKLTVRKASTYTYTGLLLVGYDVYDTYYRYDSEKVSYVRDYDQDEYHYETATASGMPKEISSNEHVRTVYKVYELLEKQYTPTHNLGSIEYISTNKAKVNVDLNAVVENDALGGSISFQVIPDLKAQIVKSSLGVPATDTSRVTTKEWTRFIGIYDYDEFEKFHADAREYGRNLRASDYYSVVSDADVKVNIQGTIRAYSNNCIILTKDYNDPIKQKGILRPFDSGTAKQIPEIPNRSKNDAYPSSGYFEYHGKTSSVPVNPVRVHTPIHGGVSINAVSKNQLSNYALAKGCKIITLEDDFSATIELNGSSVYYSDITTYLQKYVKEVYYECELCGAKGSITPSEHFTHNCKVDINKADNHVYYFKCTVVAKNIDSVTNFAVGSRITNQPDNEYKITYKAPIYVAGKIFDFEVRTTDDPGWTLANAEKLSKLPIGEKGDNANTKYQSPIKLGYRAYFDIKTLSSASTKLELKPKIYYVDLNGRVDNHVAFWYKSAQTGYRKLSASDITIKMNMANTKGEVNNDVDFLLEKVNMINMFPNINYNSVLNIGGLKRILLTQNNATMTKYKGEFHAKAKRWYGEIYMPASTIVSEEGATVTEVASGKKVKKTGYIVVVFDEINTLTLDEKSQETTYLGYGIAKNPDWVDDRPYILVNDKQSTTAPCDVVDGVSIKNNIVLPNGKMLDSKSKFSIEDLRTDAPVIIYDVSLRANDDFESSGTH